MTQPRGPFITNNPSLAKIPRLTLSLRKRSDFFSSLLAFQSVAEPRLGALGLRLLAFGYSARKVCEELLSTDPGRESRQIGIVDADGRTAAYTGTENLSWAGHVMSDGFVAMGNVLAGEEVAEAIAEEYQASGVYAFEDRLLRAVEAGRDAGGQEEASAQRLC
jgi:uncharacterized Ntn-hydrolase superfamily protein